MRLLPNATRPVSTQARLAQVREVPAEERQEQCRRHPRGGRHPQGVSNLRQGALPASVATLLKFSVTGFKEWCWLPWKLDEFLVDVGLGFQFLPGLD